MEQRPPNPIEKLTVGGRVLLLITFLLFGGGFCLTFLFIGNNFPTGLYPIVLLIMPAGLVCFFFFLIVAKILDRCGLKIYAKPPRKE